MDSSVVRQAIAEVIDPELEISVVDLGLIYGIRLELRDDEMHAEIDMTLTSPGCPVGPELMAAVHRASLTAKGLESANLNLVWTPRWDPKIHATEDAQFEMGIF